MAHGEERVLTIGEADKLFLLSLPFFFSPSFVFRLRNYIPRALSAARSSAIIAERSYSRADEHPALPYTYITRGVLRYVQQAYPTHFPFASRRSAVETSAPSNGKVGTCKLYVFMRPLCLCARDYVHAKKNEAIPQKSPRNIANITEEVLYRSSNIQRISICL